MTLTSVIIILTAQVITGGTILVIADWWGKRQLNRLSAEASTMDAAHDAAVAESIAFARAAAADAAASAQRALNSVRSD